MTELEDRTLDRPCNFATTDVSHHTVYLALASQNTVGSELFGASSGLHCPVKAHGEHSVFLSKLIIQRRGLNWNQDNGNLILF